MKYELNEKKLESTFTGNLAKLVRQIAEWEDWVCNIDERPDLERFWNIIDEFLDSYLNGYGWAPNRYKKRRKEFLKHYKCKDTEKGWYIAVGNFCADVFDCFEH